MTTLVLCRHAEPGNEVQAAALAERLSEFELAAVYTSPIPRARETARAVVASPVEVDALREIDFGEVDGVAFDDLPAELREQLLREPTRVRFPGGESYADLQCRVCAALDEIVARHAGYTVAVITHAGAIRAALAEWLRVGDDAVFRIDQRYAAVNVVEWNDGIPLVRLVNG
jgi:broad specificity phosphatase PhoE